MKPTTRMLRILLLAGLTLSISSAQEQKKLAQTGLKFLGVSVDARASALGDASTALNMSSAAMLYNPATMAMMDHSLDLSFGTTQWIADIRYIHAAASLIPFGTDVGVFGISFVRVDYGTLQGTIVAPNEQGYLDVGDFSPAAMAVGIGYAKALSVKFSVGGSIRYLRQSLGTSVVDIDGSGNFIAEDNSVNTFSADFGILYRTGFKSLDFAMCVRNFSTEVTYKKEAFELPLLFKIGIAMNALDFIEMDRMEHALNVVVDITHPRDYPEQLLLGAEYVFMDAFALRGGYSYPKDEGGFTGGFGMRQNVAGMYLKVDYAYASFGAFNDSNSALGVSGIHRITVGYGF